MARWIKRKTNERKETRINQRSPPRGSTGWRHRFNCDLLRRHGRAQGHVEPLPHLSEKQTARQLNVRLLKEAWMQTLNKCAIGVTACAPKRHDGPELRRDIDELYEEEEEPIRCYSTSATWTCYRLRLHRWETVSREHEAGASFAEELHPSQAAKAAERSRVQNRHFVFLRFKKAKPTKVFLVWDKSCPQKCYIPFFFFF